MRPLKDTLPAASDKVLYFFTILRQPKIQNMRTSLKYTYLISSVRSSCARDAKTWKTETACDAVGGSTFFGKIPQGDCSYT